MIKGFNDTEDTFNKFAKIILPAKDKVTVRISRVNQTKPSLQYNIQCGSIENMKLLSTVLSDNGIKNYIFYSEKNDDMNCGQLIYSIEKEKIG